MYRVYDKKKKRWVKDGILLTPDGELIESKKSLFGSKLTFVNENRYVYQKSIELSDKNGKEIFIGDHLEAEVADDRVVSGVVIFAEELGSYVILCFDTDEYYVLSQSVCSRILVIGNVFDKPKKDEQNGQQTLQESKI